MPRVEIVLASTMLSEAGESGSGGDPVTSSAYVHRFDADLSGRRAALVDEDEAIANALESDVVVCAEFHPLPSACLTAARILSAAATRDGARPVLGLELIHGRDQRALDDFLAGRIGERELRRRAHDREEWGYSWTGPRLVLREVRRLGLPAFGIDVPRRGGVDSLALRDRVMARRAVALLREGFRPVVLVVGEAHAARAHLPARLRRAAGAGLELVRWFHDLPVASSATPGLAARWKDASTFVSWRTEPDERPRRFAATLRRWAREDRDGADGLAEARLVHDLIGLFAAECGIDVREHWIGPRRVLADAIPEVVRIGRGRELEQALAVRAADAKRRVKGAVREATFSGARWVIDEELIVVGDGSLSALARECARWILAAVGGEIPRGASASRGPAERRLTGVLTRAFVNVVDPSGASAVSGFGSDAEALADRLGALLVRRAIPAAQLRRWARAAAATDGSADRALAALARAVEAREAAA